MSLMIKVKSVERAGTPQNRQANPTLVFDVSTDPFSTQFRKASYKSVKKTYDEFVRLFKYLNAAIQECFIPSLPPAYTNYFGISDSQDSTKTVHNFQRWFNRISKEPLVLKNEEFVSFIESDHNSYTPVNRSRLPASGLVRHTLKQLHPPYDEVVDLAEFRPIIKSIHWISKDINKSLIRASKLQKNVSHAQHVLGQNFIQLSNKSSNEVANSNGNLILSSLYKKFGKIIIAVSDVDNIMGTLDLASLSDGLDWIISDTYVVKESLTNRHFIMRELTKATQSTATKDEQLRKLRAKKDANPLNVEDCARQYKDAFKYEQQLTLKLKRITSNMLLGRKQWLKWYEAWLTDCIKEYTLYKLEYHRKKLALWEKVRADVRNADANGGLSRLGRQHHTLSRHTTTPPQRAGSTDSWSGDTRDRHQAVDSPITAAAETSAVDARHAAALLGMTATF